MKKEDFAEANPSLVPEETREGENARLDQQFIDEIIKRKEQALRILAEQRGFVAEIVEQREEAGPNGELYKIRVFQFSPHEDWLNQHGENPDVGGVDKAGPVKLPYRYLEETVDEKGNVIGRRMVGVKEVPLQ